MNVRISTPPEERRAALDAMILSASGWRAVFGGSDQSLTHEISAAHHDLVVMATRAFVRFVQSTGINTPTILIATDTRPTGPAIAHVAMRATVSMGATVRWLGVAATPEVIAYAAMPGVCDAFLYISASHNPPGHNGLKMGRAGSGVLPGRDARALIAQFRHDARDEVLVEESCRMVAAVTQPAIEKLIAEAERHKSEALRAYRRHVLAVASSQAPFDSFEEALRGALHNNSIGIVGELNGSARAVTIDRELLTSVGARVAFFNTTPGTFSHQILPEGAGLDEATHHLLAMRKHSPEFLFAYVPDNDGDRGNLVFVDPESGTAGPLEAQAVFALATLVELAWAHLHSPEAERLAVVANGPTSLRIDEICAVFGARVFRAEVGEANVLELADAVEKQGFRVLIVGEGSNGGTIVPPSRVRDPLSTILSVLKLYGWNLDRVWDQLSERPERTGETPNLFALMKTLPPWQTLETDDPRAKLTIGALPHATLKSRWEERLTDAIPAILPELASAYAAPISYELVNYEGHTSTPGPGNRSGDETGGLRLVFRDATTAPVAAVWMRGSGTEPVFRLLAECRGTDRALLDRLTAWHRASVEAVLPG